MKSNLDYHYPKKNDRFFRQDQNQTFRKKNKNHRDCTFYTYHLAFCDLINNDMEYIGMECYRDSFF